LSSKLNTVSCSNCFTSHDYLDFDGWGYCAWQDMVPPKDPYIKVRVLDDMGEGILLSDKTANLARHSMHFLKRTDAEQYIARVGCHGDLVSWNCLLTFCSWTHLNFTFFLVWSTGLDGRAYRLTLMQQFPRQFQWRWSFKCERGPAL